MQIHHADADVDGDDGDEGDDNDIDDDNDDNDVIDDNDDDDDDANLNANTIACYDANVDPDDGAGFSAVACVNAGNYALTGAVAVACDEAADDVITMLNLVMVWMILLNLYTRLMLKMMMWLLLLL